MTKTLIISWMQPKNQISFLYKHCALSKIQLKNMKNNRYFFVIFKKQIVVRMKNKKKMLTENSNAIKFSIKCTTDF